MPTESVPVSLREHEANDAYQRPWPKCEPSLKIRFFTVSYSWSGPHGASYEKRETGVNNLHYVESTNYASLYAVVPATS